MKKQFIDCDVMPNGMQARGCLPRDDKCGSDWPVFEDQFDIYPREDWPELIEQNTSLREVVQRIYNQRQEGSCASNATCQAMEIAWRQTLGPAAYVAFSPISIYRWVANGPNDGSVISHNLRQLRDVGALPLTDEASKASLQRMGLPQIHTLEHTGYYQSFPDGWKTTAGYFQCVEWYDIESFDGIISALLDDFPVVYGRSGHAICGVAPYQDGRTFGIEYANSWGDWGDNGYGRDTESKISRAVKSYGAWALRAVKITDESLLLTGANL